MSGDHLVSEAALEPRRHGKWWGSIPWVPTLIIVAIVFMAVAAPILTPHDYRQQDLTQILSPPAFLEDGNPEHLLGTDRLGRDYLTRIMYGGRMSLLVALLTMVVAGGIGLFIGIIAGYLKGPATSAIDRVIDTTLSFPTLLVAMLLVVVVGPGLLSVVIAISVVLWARFARVIRGEVLALRDLDFISQARITGCSPMRIMFRHIIPNVLNTFMVLISLQVGWVIVVEATLSFLGAGIPPPYPTWGRLVSDGRAYIHSHWWLSLLPGIFITLLVLSLNLFGNWLRDYLDPKLRQVM